jgi:hypothetical protein
MDAARRVSHLLVGSWTRLGVAAALVLAVWLAFAWLAATGRLAEVRYVNLPLVHPYPPAGYIQNPFNPADKSDLVNLSEANRVRADLLRNGEMELLAAERGDVGLLKEGHTGSALERLTAFIAQNNAQGIFERVENHFESIAVGRLSDPNDPKISWAVREKGTATISYYSKSTGTLIRQQRVRFHSTFWLVPIGDRYLIADSLVQTEPMRQ